MKNYRSVAVASFCSMLAFSAYASTEGSVSQQAEQVTTQTVEQAKDLAAEVKADVEEMIVVAEENLEEMNKNAKEAWRVSKRMSPT